VSDSVGDVKFNAGINTIGDGAVLGAAERTYVVLGVSRGGTSAVAGLLNIFGVHMGRSGRAPLFEDLRMNRALGEGLPQVEARIAESNSERPVWGFKGNAIPQDYSAVAARLRNPVFVVIFRDLLAIANRAQLSAGRDIAWILERQAREYQRIVDFVATAEYYSVLLSFEKLSAHPAEVVPRLAELTGLPLDEERRRKALEFIRPAPEDYLRVSRANKAPDGQAP